MIPLADIDNDWTLFIDRDGVINYEKANDYIHTWDEFAFYEMAKKSFEIFAKVFKYIIVITNQKGVGKGLTKETDLHFIHQNMKLEIEKGYGRIDAIYYCSDIDNDSPNRKPNPGMGLQALKDFEDINFSKSIMVGNNISDMQFGKNLGSYTIFLKTTHPNFDTSDKTIDAAYDTLYQFALTLV